MEGCGRFDTPEAKEIRQNEVGGVRGSEWSGQGKADKSKVEVTGRTKASRIIAQGQTRRKTNEGQEQRAGP